MATSCSKECYLRHWYEFFSVLTLDSLWDEHLHYILGALMTNYMATFSSLICSPAHLLIHRMVPNWTFLLPGVVSVQFSHSVKSDSLQSHGPQHTRLPCPSPTPRAYSNLCSSSRWCHTTISSSVTTFSIGLQSFPASGSFLRSQFFASGVQSIGVSALASVLPMNIQDWFPLGWTH